jgi:FecR protein
MKSKSVFDVALLSTLVCACLAGVPAPGWGQSFAGSVELAGIDTGQAALITADGSLYTDGRRAINEERWANAEAIFTMIANQHGDHSAGALYWKAYAENKLGRLKPALASCAELRQAFPSSSWIHDCGALEIEIAARSGKPLEPQATQDDDLKLLALTYLMQKDESRAMAQIQEILNGNSSDQLKKEAAFLLGQHYSDATYPQIVRIRHVEGDVRVARGGEKGQPAGATWETAVSDLPLQTGFSLVTGAGRAEIEFEDASTLYLAENSVLTFNDLHTTSGVPYSDLALLTGTVSLDVHTNIRGEEFFLRTPTDSFLSQYPEAWVARVSSYLDGTAYTQKRLLVYGQTKFFREGQPIDSAGPHDPGGFADWDKWVEDRVTQRTAAMSDVMKASGLTSPIPGLADMEGQGTFFACAPYGTCWEPSAKGAPQQAKDSQTFGQGVHIVRADFHLPARFGGAQPMQTGLLDPLGLAYEADFPCFPAAVRYRLVTDPATGTGRLVDTGGVTNAAPWNWAVCHAGSWIQRRHHYCWVVGHKRHHIPPIRWVKSEHKVAFVPIHPYDVKGRPPINRKEEVFAVSNKNGISVARVPFQPGHGIEELKSPPREYRGAYRPPLSRAETPHMEAHSIKDGPRGVSLSFDPRAHSFMMPKQVTYGNKTATVLAPMTNRGGTLQASGGRFGGVHSGITSGGAARGGGFSGGGSYAGAGSTGGGSHGGGGGGGFSGGGSHGGGGGSTGGSSGAASSGGGHR